MRAGARPDRRAQAARTTRGLELVQSASAAPQAVTPARRAEPPLRAGRQDPAPQAAAGRPRRRPAGRGGTVSRAAADRPRRRPAGRGGAVPRVAADRTRCPQAGRQDPAPEAIGAARQASQGDRGDRASGVRGGGVRRAHPLAGRDTGPPADGPGQRDERALAESRCRRPSLRRSRPGRAVGSGAGQHIPVRARHPGHPLSPAAPRAASSPRHRRGAVAQQPASGVKRPAARVQLSAAGVRGPVPQSVASGSRPDPRTCRHGR